jgi:hypothetical protein
MSQVYDSFSWWVALFLLVVYIAIDALYVVYTLSITQLNSRKAGLVSGAMYLIIAAGTTNYIRNPLYIVVVAIGASIGTFATVEFEKRKKQ